MLRKLSSTYSSRVSPTRSLTKYGQSRTLLTEATVGAVVSTGTFVFLRYKVSNPDQYLIRTGPFIKDIEVSKRGFQWPFQKYQFVNMQPANFSFNLNSMSQEKLEFMLPCVFTIGPKNDIESIKNYSRLLMTISTGTDLTKTIHGIIQGIIEGETRVLSASLTIEQIFNDRKTYKETLLRDIQIELERFGLEVYNVNIKELHDTPGSSYFEQVRQRKTSQAENNAKVDIAEAQKTGNIGHKEREAATRQQVAQFESETVLKENERQQEIEKSNAELEVIKAQAQQRIQIARIEADNFSKIREAEMQQEVEKKRIAMETERFRAEDYSKAIVVAEINIKTAEGEATSLKLKSEAELFSEQRKADGILAVYDAQSAGIEKLIASFGGDNSALAQYLMIDKGMYEKLAQANAIAVKDMKPKIVQWNTSGGEGNNAVTDLLKMLPPILTTIHDQTGIKPGNWLVNMPNNNTKKE